MFKNLTQLRAELANRLKNTSIGSARLTGWLNDAQDMVAGMMDPDHLIINSTFSTTASTRLYYLPFEFNKVLSIIDTSTNIELEQTNEPYLEGIDPDRSTTGTPYFYATQGMDWVKGQPTSATTISIVSSETTDTTQRVRINGVVNSVADTEILTLNGTTTVTGTKSFSEIYTIAKDSTTAGKITVTAGAVTIGAMAPNELAHQYQAVSLWPTPDSTLTMRARGIRRCRAMVNDQDFPDYPATFHELILIAATVRGNRDLFRPRIADNIMDNELKPMIKELQKQMGNKRLKRSVVIQGPPPLRTGGRLGPRFGD